MSGKLMLVAVLLLISGCTSAMHKDEIKTHPYQRGIVVNSNYQKVAQCIYEFEVEPGQFLVSAQFGTEMKIMSDLNFAYFGFGGRGVFTILIEMKKLDQNTTSIDIYSVPDVVDEAEIYSRAIRSC